MIVFTINVYTSKKKLYIHTFMIPKWTQKQQNHTKPMHSFCYHHSHRFHMMKMEALKAQPCFSLKPMISNDVSECFEVAGGLAMITVMLNESWLTSKKSRMLCVPATWKPVLKCYKFEIGSNSY